ncbi:type IV toxin-antitoxin system AbiEi family antitoxin domain-containing protein [uncultured Amnibacterium sp.]|uniref:type IV toxin-antitoxin system AbiEi family antitoxin domain-containing protein n=1 Tax=uncultured Amnibacterium sp. TaxID=1631851 RepID=UPI0035C94405
MPGPFFTTRDLLRAGETHADLTHSVRSGLLLRPRQGHYAMPDAPSELIRAVKLGGLATATTAAQHCGVFVAPDNRLHVSVRRNTASCEIRTIPRSPFATG